MHEQEMLRLSNEHEKDMKLLEIMQGIINKIDSLNQFLSCEHGEHQAVGFGALAFFLMLKPKKKKNAKTRSKKILRTTRTKCNRLKNATNTNKP